MTWRVDAYVTGLVITGIAALIIAAIAVQYRDRPGATPLALTLMALALWSIVNVFEANAATIALKVLWSQVSYIGIVSLPVFLIAFAAQFTQRDRWLSPLSYGLLSVIPAITFVLALTNGGHGLIWSDIQWVPGDSGVVYYSHGPWFWVYLAQFYLLILASVILLLTEARRVHRLYRRQSLMILAGIAPSVLVNALYLFAPNVFGGRDWTPVSLFFSVALTAWAFAELQLLSLVPMAREAVLDTLHDGVIVIDSARLVVDANPTACAILGSDDLVGRDLIEVLSRGPCISEVPDLSQVPFRRAPDGVLESEEVPTLTGSFAIGGQRHLAWRLSPIHHRTRRVPGFVFILHDVTEQRAASDALRRMNATLETKVSERTAAIQAQQEQSDAILRSVSDSVFMTDRDLILRYVNPAFTELSGHEYAKALGEPAETYVGKHVHARLVAAQEKGSPWRGESRALRSDGRLTEVDLTVAPVRNQSGHVVGYVCTEHDITKAKRLEKARKGILDNISHQLRTPVTTLKLYSHLLSQADLPDEHQRTVKVIGDQILWLQRIIEEILEMTSLDSSEGVGSWTVVSVAQLMDHLLARFEPRAAQQEITLTLASSPRRGLAVKGDTGRLIQALAEVVRNALAFTPAGGSVEISANEQDGSGRPGVTIKVQDTGPGIPDDEMPRVLERFFRGKITESGQYPGAGLGLNIAQSIVVTHNGRLRLDSSTGGTAVSIWLPTLATRVDGSPIPEPKQDSL